MLPAFTRDEIQHILAEYGYASNPEGLIQPFAVDYISAPEGVAFLDINADAVRKGNEVPDRPIRITFHIIFDGVSSSWKLKSVEELAPGVQSKSLDRHPDTPKISPWPDAKTSAEKLYQAVKKFAAETKGWSIGERRIRSITFRDHGRIVKATVGRPDPCEGGLVVAILESETYLICTPTRGVQKGEPLMVGKDEVSDVEEFDV